MQIFGDGTETFLFINGLEARRPIRLGEHVELLPARFAAAPEVLGQLFQMTVDFGVAHLFLQSVSSQIRVVGSEPEELATRAWNSVWDAVLLSAVFHCEAVCNFQSGTAIEALDASSRLEVTNYHLRGLPFEAPRLITPAEEKWIEQNFSKSRHLLRTPGFQNAVHCLATYKWHTLPRARLALLWSGIEGLFGVANEVVFRVSLCAARFLEPEDSERRKLLFNKVKQLYKHRSQAVHGSTMKGQPGEAVQESAELLYRLIHACIEAGALPDQDKLLP